MPAENVTLGPCTKLELQVGKTHRYSIKLKADQFFHVAVTAPDIQLLITVKGAAGESIAAGDTSDGATGERSIFATAAHDRAAVEAQTVGL